MITVVRIAYNENSLDLSHFYSPKADQMELNWTLFMRTRGNIIKRICRFKVLLA